MVPSRTPDACGISYGSGIPPWSTFLGDLGAEARAGYPSWGSNKQGHLQSGSGAKQTRVPSLAPSHQCGQGRLFSVSGWNCSGDVGQYGQ